LALWPKLFRRLDGCLYYYIFANESLLFMLLIYTPRITKRLNFILRLLFHELLGLDTGITSKVEEYLSCSGPKLAYGVCPQQGELYLASSGLLFETGISGKELRYIDFEGVKAFFPVYDDASFFPFDVLSASFFLVSRYEEYLPHIRDVHGRFQACTSEAFKHGFLRRPLVNIWALSVKQKLAEKYPGMKFGNRSFRFIPTYDIDAAYSFRHKGFTRAIGGFMKALQVGNFAEIKQRIRVFYGTENDPFDTFPLQFEWQKKYNLNPVYFILFADYGLNDKNIPVNNRYFQALIKAIADYAEVGIHPSYGSNSNPGKLGEEISRLSKVLKREITRSRQHFLKLEFPATYRNLINLDITEDYSMGFASEPGFRAGICDPFNFFDLDLDIETTLRVYPFAVMDGTLNDYMKLKPENAFSHIEPMLNEVKMVGGTFISLWHNESLSNAGRWRGWLRVYEELLISATS
jgi:hypothetical protein